MFSNCMQGHPAGPNEEDECTYLVTVPVLEELVLAHGPEVVRRLGVALARVVALERDLHHALVVCEERLVAVAEVEAPDFDILVRRARHNELRVARDVHREDRELVSIQREEELERVLIEDLYCRVQQRDGE